MAAPTAQQVIDVLTLRAGEKTKAEERTDPRTHPRTRAIFAGEAAAYADAANLVRRMLIEGKAP